MITKFKAQPARAAVIKLRSFWNARAASALTAVFVLTVISARATHGQTTGLEINSLAQGYSLDHEVKLHAKGPSDVLQSLLVFQPGGDTGWHIHPGPVVVVVKNGALTEYHSDGSVTVHPAGSVFFEEKDEVHRAVNETGTVVEVYATFISPSGTQPLIPVPAPTPGNHSRVN
jgi:quercetin dioxygenase-like cupin family protein